MLDNANVLFVSRIVNLVDNSIMPPDTNMVLSMLMSRSWVQVSPSAESYS